MIYISETTVSESVTINFQVHILNVNCFITVVYPATLVNCS